MKVLLFALLAAISYAQTAKPTEGVADSSKDVTFAEPEDTSASGETPEAVESGETPEAVESGETPEAVEGGEGAETVEAETPEEVVDVTEASEPEAVDSGETVETPEVETVDSVDSTDSVSEPETPDSIDSTDSSGSADTSDSGSDATGSSPSTDNGDGGAGATVEGAGEAEAESTGESGDITSEAGDATSEAGEGGDANMVGADQDVHGCIASAGYSWCASTATCIRTFETNCPAAGDVWQYYPLFHADMFEDAMKMDLEDAAEDYNPFVHQAMSNYINTYNPSMASQWEAFSQAARRAHAMERISLQRRWQRARQQQMAQNRLQRLFTPRFPRALRNPRPAYYHAGGPQYSGRHMRHPRFGHVQLPYGVSL